MAQATIAFDIGGTSSRCAVVDADGSVYDRSSQPSPTHRSTSAHPNHLRAMIVDYVLDTSAKVRARHPDLSLQTVAISIGAAVNARDHVILNSGPLWGSDSTPFDLIGSLRERDTHSRFYVVNDVTAALHYHAHIARNDGLARLALITISTGIATRSYDFRTASVPVDREVGLQGEIGHLPVEFRALDQAFSMRCDCGGADHLNAYCSGRGIENVLRAMRDASLVEWLPSRREDSPDSYHCSLSFARQLNERDPLAEQILSDLVRPVVSLLQTIFVVDPDVERLVIDGGVLRTIPGYASTLIHQLTSLGLYQRAIPGSSFFRDRLTIGMSDGNAELVGAALIAVHDDDHDKMQRTEDNTEARQSDGTLLARWTVRATRDVRYSIIETTGLLTPHNGALADLLGVAPVDSRRLVVLDTLVSALLGDRIRHYFDAHGVECDLLELQISEHTKSPQAVEAIVRAMSNWGIGRRQVALTAVGGGVVLDAAGLAASLFRRGTPYVKVPTTLLAVVDAAVGVKVGVNFEGGRNLLGDYYPPVATLYDIALLGTLEPRQVRSGLGEIIKIAVARDSGLFDTLEEEGPELLRGRFDLHPSARSIVNRSIGSMIAELTPNLWEEDLARAADLGHSFSPYLEKQSKGSLLHGEAVAIDIALSTLIAGRRGLMSGSDSDRVLQLLQLVTPPRANWDAKSSHLQDTLLEVALHRGGRQRIPLPTGIGAVTFVDDISTAELDAAIIALRHTT